eukprot:1790472-Karenia_brevis.AAC.1
MAVKENDVIVIASDGVGDNLTMNPTKEIIGNAMRDDKGDPWLIAQKIVDLAIQMNKKPDDVSCAVGIVVKK